MNRAFAAFVLIGASPALLAGASVPATSTTTTSTMATSTPATCTPAPAPADVAPAKQTSLGLYLTARGAYEKWKADPARVKILDVRTPEEYIFVGHAEGAWNVPLLLQTYEWDANGRNLAMTPNPEFLDRVEALFEPSDTLVVICRSGGRSAKAVDRLAAAGFTQVFSVVDGMEGDPLAGPASGWKNSGLPWTYDLDPAKMSLPAARPGAATKR